MASVLKSTSSTVGPLPALALAPISGIPPGIPPGILPGIPPGIPPGAPPAAAYNFWMIGEQTPSISFFLSSNSSFSAVWLASIQATASLHLSKTVFLSSSESLSATFSSSTLVFGIHVQDTIGINIEGYINLRNSTGCWWNATKFELSKEVVVFGHGSLTFVHLNQHTRLVVSVSGERLRLLGWNGSVTFDQGCHNTTSCFNTKRQRSHIQKKQILHCFTLVTLQNGSLNGSTKSNSFIRIDRVAQFLSIEEILEKILHLGNTS